MGVPTEDHVGPLVVERSPERLHYVRVGGRRSEQRVMEGGRRARRRMGCEILREPRPLGGGCAATAHLVAVAVQDDDVPAPAVVAVVALAGIACLLGAEVVEVGGGALGAVLVVTHGGLREGPHTRVHYLERDV
jgi:hypothetical protein